MTSAYSIQSNDIHEWVAAAIDRARSSECRAHNIAPRGCHEKTKGLIDEPTDHSRTMPVIVEVGDVAYPLTYVSRRQYDVIRCISESIEEKGYPPTVAEIRDAIGVRSTHAVTDHLERLVARGLIVLVPTHARTIQLVMPLAAFAPMPADMQPNAVRGVAPLPYKGILVAP